MHIVENGLLALFAGLIALPFGIGGFIIGGTYQGIVVTGLHQMFNAFEINLISSTGVDAFNGIITGTIMAQGAAALAVALRTRNKKKRSFYLSASIPAFFGITEPAIFGVNLILFKPFVYALIGGAASGGFAAFMKLAADGMGVTALLGSLLYLGTGQIVTYLIANAIGFGIAFCLTYFLFDPNKEDKNSVSTLAEQEVMN